jgi:tetratricopeptide (TPR) repeat protein
MKRWATLALLLLGCGGPTNLERQADGDLADGRVDAAVAAYQRMAERSPDGRVLAKLGSAALRGGKLGIAVDAFARLGREDPSRRAEAADGLDAAARAADRLGDTLALRLAVIALADVAPNRPAGRYVLALEKRNVLTPGERALLAPSALAAAADAETSDSLLMRYARDRVAAGDCELAAGLFRAVARRSPVRERVAAAREGQARCALTVGRLRLEARQPAEALPWLEEAIAIDSASSNGLAAMDYLARALRALGDSDGAAVIDGVRARKAPADSGTGAQ